MPVPLPVRSLFLLCLSFGLSGCQLTADLPFLDPALFRNKPASAAPKATNPETATQTTTQTTTQTAAVSLGGASASPVPQRSEDSSLASPTALPLAQPTAAQSNAALAFPVTSPTSLPSLVPTASPSAASPTASPTILPTSQPTLAPTALPTSTPVPSALPSPVPTPTATPTSVPSPTPTSGSAPASLLAAILEQTNAERSTAGLGQLNQNSLLEQAAQAHAQDMAQNSYFSHTGQNGSTPGTRITATGYVWQGYAENIAYGYGSVTALMTGWMNSAGHRANILTANLTEIGIGYALSASGQPYYVQVFGKPR